MERDYEITIDRPVGNVFAVLAAVERYHEWLPPSKTFIRVELDVDEPIKLGSTFIDIQRKGSTMRGEVHIYDPPHQIGFRQASPLPLGSAIKVRMEYTLKPEGNRTHVVRHHVFDVPFLLRPTMLYLKPMIITENRRIVERLRSFCEGSATTPSIPN